jgi:hypothetical protein
MTLNFHKKPQRDFVFHFLLKFLLFPIYFIFFALYFFFSTPMCMQLRVAVLMSYIRHRSVWYIYMYVTFPTLNDNMTDYQSQSPCRHAKTVLESLFVLCVYRPHDIGIGVASDQIRKSYSTGFTASRVSHSEVDI